MNLMTWLSLATICVLGAVSPGPSLALVINNTVAGGTRRGLMTAIGHGVGVGLYALITALGLAVIIKQTPMLFSAIQYGGAAFLLYTAARILLSKSQPQSGDNSTAATAHSASRFVGFGGGFMVAFLNPKLALFFLALFSQFVSPEQGWWQHLIMMLTAGGIDALWYAVVALGIGGTGLLAILKRHQVWVDRLSAMLFIALALVVIISS
ncbi:LysE family translocator [Ferrimonas senticii]|uniref:LysE family translocator n=1 Tax=Ferrimonas senticii TaxID=394566 RepID=UPI00041E407A|nr:LysE family translocator [Ferrimonas senticii]